MQDNPATPALNSGFAQAASTQWFDDRAHYPVELPPADIDIVKFIKENNYSMGTMERLYSTAMASRYVLEQRILGDFVECGVWRGGHAIIALDIFRRAGDTRKAWLFDTFLGMTTPTQADSSPSGNHALTKFLERQHDDHNKWCYAPIDEVKDNFCKANVPLDAAIFVKGDVQETLRSSKLPEKISILRLDTDFYESTKLELEVLYPRLSNGGILILDDYGYWSGARKAVDEYFANRPKPFLQFIDYAGRSGVKQSI